jgi:spore maturation protein CgeB
VSEGLDTFFRPTEEIILAKNAADVTAALEASDQELLSMARRARERTLEEHSSSRRATELIKLIECRADADSDFPVAAEA